MRTYFHLAGVVLALILALASLPRYLAPRAEKADLLERLAESQTLPLSGDLLESLRREPDPAYARVLAARALLAAAMEPGVTSADLPLARDLAAEALEKRPVSWQASMILGAATYLRWSKEEDPRLFRQYRAWEAPLLHATELAPGRPEPRRFLATAYLEMWPALSPAKRELTRRLLREALTDPATFNRLIEPWLSVAETRQEALELIPATSFAWSYLEAQASRAADWEEYLAARAHRRDAAESEQRALLAQAEERLRGGDLRWGRSLLLRLIAVTRPGLEERDLLDRALAQVPAGPGNAAAEATLAGWLRWALELCLLDRCPFPTATLDRMTGLAGELPVAEAALAAAFTDRLEEGERLERRAEDLWHERWGPYFLGKAKALVRRGDPDAAAQALPQLPRAWSDHPLAWETRRQVAHAKGDGTTEDQARGALSQLARASWGPEAWTWEAPRWRSFAMTSSSAEEIVLDFFDPPERGSVVEVRMDGASVGLAAVFTGDRIEMTVRVEPGLHLWEIETLTGGSLKPRELTLRPGS
jgi:hypothetical protein